MPSLHAICRNRVLDSIAITGSIEIIEERAFGSCDSFTNITISDGTAYIGECAFAECGSIVDVVIPDTVEFIGNKAFDKNNSFLTASVAWNSYAAEWCEANGINSIYPDNTDWLHN